GVAWIQEVPFAYVPAIHADALRQAIHDAFHGELRLVAAEATHRAAGRIVRVDRLRFDIHIRDPVRPARMARGTEQALAARPGIAARIAENPGAHGEQVSVTIGADRVLQRHRMALDV